MSTNFSQDALLAFVRELNNTYLGPLLILLLLGTGLYFTFRLCFIQKYLIRATCSIFKGKKHGKASRKEGMSPFQALSTAVASQLGTGNIIGVATAIAAGGPGAIVWLWVSIVLGMATNYAEALLSQLYKTSTPDGHVIGGPAYYISRGLNSKILANIFAVVAVFALGFMGTIVQTNSITLTMSTVLPDSVHNVYIGIAVAVLVGVVLIGGISRIASFAERIVPIMASVYFIAGISVILINYDCILPVFKAIFSSAFNPSSVGGGVLGFTVMKALRYGVSRGLFSNEAGLGTTPHAHAVAKVKKPYEQGLTAIVGVGTNLIICTLSALIVLVSGYGKMTDKLASLLPGELVEWTTYFTPNSVQTSFGETFGMTGSIFVAITLFFFSLTTIVGWYFFAAQNLRFLCGGEKLITPFRALVVLFVVLGSVLEVELVWELMDTFNVFLVVPNVIALLYLSPKVLKQTKILKEDIKNKEY